jgi:hypothetical protein
MVRLAVRRHLRRVASWILAIVLAAGVMVGSTVAPASADTFSNWQYLQNGVTLQCLATDYSGAVITWNGCNDDGQKWRFRYLAREDLAGLVMLQNKVTLLCLMQIDFLRVRSASCDSSRAEFRWMDSDEYINSANTGGQLVSDYDGRVALHNPWHDPGQRWVSIF